MQTARTIQSAVRSSKQHTLGHDRELTYRARSSAPWAAYARLKSVGIRWIGGGSVGALGKRASKSVFSFGCLFSRGHHLAAAPPSWSAIPQPGELPLPPRKNWRKTKCKGSEESDCGRRVKNKNDSCWPFDELLLISLSKACIYHLSLWAAAASGRTTSGTSSPDDDEDAWAAASHSRSTLPAEQIIWPSSGKHNISWASSGECFDKRAIVCCKMRVTKVGVRKRVRVRAAPALRASPHGPMLFALSTLKRAEFQFPHVQPGWRDKGHGFARRRTNSDAKDKSKTLDESPWFLRLLLLLLLNESPFVCATASGRTAGGGGGGSGGRIKPLVVRLSRWIFGSFFWHARQSLNQAPLEYKENIFREKWLSIVALLLDHERRSSGRASV